MAKTTQKATTPKAPALTPARGLVSVFPGFAALQGRTTNSLFPGFIDLAIWHEKVAAATAKSNARALRKEASALRKAERVARREAGKTHKTPANAVFDFGIVRVKAARKTPNAYRVTFVLNAA